MPIKFHPVFAGVMLCFLSGICIVACFNFTGMTLVEINEIHENDKSGKKKGENSESFEYEATFDRQKQVKYQFETFHIPAFVNEMPLSSEERNILKPPPKA